MNRTSSGSEMISMRRARVRLTKESERPRLDQLLQKHHYLHNARLGGRSFRDVTQADDQWVALLCFRGADPHLKAPDQKIARTPRQRVRRLLLVVNHSRFLVPAHAGIQPCAWMATLRNVVPGLFELQKHRPRARAPGSPRWPRRLTTGPDDRPDHPAAIWGQGGWEVGGCGGRHR